MEKEGFIRCLDNLHNNFDANIAIVSTDRHNQIRALMRTDDKYKNIKHQYDPWHIAKGIYKKLHKLSKKKGTPQIISLPTFDTNCFSSFTSSFQDLSYWVCGHVPL